MKYLMEMGNRILESRAMVKKRVSTDTETEKEKPTVCYNFIFLLCQLITCSDSCITDFCTTLCSSKSVKNSSKHFLLLNF